MNKKIFCLLLLLIMPVMVLCGCKEVPISDDYTIEENDRFVYVKEYAIDEDTAFKILMDKETKVMYLYYFSYLSNGKTMTGMTVMLNADGTPMIWEGEL